MAMNVGRSIRIALAQRDKSASWLAKALGVNRQWVSVLTYQDRASGATIEKLADAFNIKSSEFIALGEERIGDRR